MSSVKKSAQKLVFFGYYSGGLITKAMKKKQGTQGILLK